MKLITVMICLGLLFSGTSLVQSEEFIQNKRVVIFFEDGFRGGSGTKPLSWYKETLADFELDVTVAGAREIGDAEFLTKSRFDTLILPNGDSIPFVAAYTILNFLSEGGNVITGRLPRYGIKYDPEKENWAKGIRLDDGTGKNMHSEFQIRHLPWEKRSLNCYLKVNSDLPSFLLKDLPPTVGPFNENCYLLDKMNYHRCGPKGWNTGDGTCFPSEKNIETAANIIFPVYLLPNDEATDFIAYRYHSAYFNGSTLILLGNLGSSLLNTIFAKDVLYTSLKLCETRLPGEEEPVYYERIVNLQRQISSFGGLFMEIYAPLRDLTFYKFYKKEKEFGELKNKMRSCEDALSYIMNKKQKIDRLLLSGSDTQVQDKERKELLIKIEKEVKRFRTIKKGLAKESKKIKCLEEVKIKSPLGGIVIEAGITKPMGLYMLRKDFFQTMKELGANVYYPQWQDRLFFKYLDDPVVKKNKSGIKFDLYSTPSYCFKEIIPTTGKLNPRTGKSGGASKKVYNYKLLEKKIKDFVEKWKDEPVLRYWSAGERGLMTKFWGEQAKEEYHVYLKEKYKNIKSLNERWQTDHKKFEEIELLTKKPVTISEHSNWEDWTNFREERYLSVLQFGYDTFKKYDSQTPVSRCTSTGSMRCPLYGTNFYQITKMQDIAGVDGTYGRLPALNEWIWFDLNCGKPFLTTEWGLFYGAPKNILEGRRKLSQGVWSEVSGGAVGINCWVWRLNSFRGNYVDTAGLPTLYGWELKNLVSDLQKFDHIILDGKREESEIRILFSDTTRCHDQDWIEGENSSLHVQATRNFYSFFLRYYQPARVIAEEAILEGTDLSNCRLLIVSAAEYLSEDLQKALIDYVKNGGNLLLDGNAGKFDNYGHPGNLLLKEAGIAPSFVKRKEIFLPAGDTFFVKKPEFAFAPSLFSKERGKALLNYAGGEPALVSVHVGKGKMLVNGAPFGLEYQIEYPESTIIMKEVMKEIDLGAKYICGDKNLIIREWEHKDSRYLICVYPKDKNLINEFLLKIKGNCKVIDYLVGAEIPSTFDGNYTSFSGLMTSPGGRVYQLKKLSSKKTSFSPERFTVVVKEVSKSNFSTTATSSLPYRGNLCIEEPKEIDGFFFQTTVISFSVDTGEAFLTVSKGKEKLKRKVEPGKDYVFSFKDTSFLVKCISVQFVYPLWMEVEIKKNKKEPVSSSCSFQKEGDKLLLSNGLVRLTIVPERGGKIIEYSTLPEKVNHLAGGGIEENEGQWPGSFFDQPFSYKIIKDTAKEIKVLLKMDHAVNDLLLKKLITIKKNEAKVDLGIEEYNYGNVSKLLSLCLHPELSIGGIADREDRFFIPTPEGLETPSYVRSRSNHYFTPKEGWACCCDKGRKVAYITSFFLDEVKTVYIWMGADRYNLELFTPKKKIESLKALSLHTELFLIKGISGVSSFREGITLYISLPNTFLLQDKEIRFTVEVGSAFLEKKRLNGKISLFKEGKMVKEIGEFSHDVSFEEPLEKEFSFSAKGLPDGVYEIIVSILDQQGKDLLSTRKELFLAGQAKKENTRIYENFKKRFERLRQRYPSKKEQLFDTFTLLEEFGSAVGENDKEKIRLEREKLQKALMAIE